MRQLFLLVLFAALAGACAHQPAETYAHQVAEAGGLRPVDSPAGPPRRAYAGRSRIIAWMPLDMAPSRNHAHQEITRLLAAAVQQALPEHQVSYQLQRPDANVVITGPGCDPECVFGGSDMHLAMVRTAPRWLGGYKAYAWISTPWRDVGAWREAYPAQAGLSAQQTMAFYRGVSANLPDWMFFYLAPGEHGTAQALIVNQGRISAFQPQVAQR